MAKPLAEVPREILNSTSKCLGQGWRSGLEEHLPSTPQRSQLVEATEMLMDNETDSATWHIYALEQYRDVIMKHGTCSNMVGQYGHCT